MGDLHLIRIIADIGELHRWAGHRGLAGRNGLDEGAALHHLLSETFGKGILQPFRLMVARGAERGTLYGYAEQPAIALQDVAASVAVPEAFRVLALKEIKGKPLTTELWPVGRRLGFDLLARPIVRLASAIDGTPFKKGAEIDAYLAEALRRGETMQPDTGRTREAVYLDWLDARLGPAAQLDQGASRLASFLRSKIRRDRTSREGPEVTIHGTLTVEDADAFAARLARGVGRHRAYGFGMLLLRPPQRC